ncbi:monooxygenase [Paenibacillus oleatilyticus]|uniref:monooxygenase n=1 Tax=Paenibacillus oleatilyticus TaxID=2594886 RepID=UPI001C1FBDEF|nr:monooxygenase [Paenibacillus oleatilyticus]MBU7314873.1 monooxygenase [Paenibacillus oleatilyticus]
MDYEVIVVGGGPVGMLLAAELALAGVKVCVFERLKDTTPYSRALTLHPRSLELFDLRGLKSKLMSIGKPLPTGHFAALDTRLDFSVLDSSSNYTLYISQHDTEKVLEEWAQSVGVEIRRETEVVSVRQDARGVEVTAVGAKGEAVLTAAYAVGADGAGSLVRKQAGIPFEGTDATLTAMLGDVVLAYPPETNGLSRFTEHGLVMIVPVTDRLHRVVMIDPLRMGVPKEEPVTLEELRSGLERILGSDLGISEPFWLSRYGNATRQAKRYREGRIFLAGDAAHIHFPAGGQGLNVGLQEAMNLGWKLAAELKGQAPGWLLDSYHTERFPVNTALLRNTQAQTLLMGFDFSPRMMGLRSMLSDLLRIPEANKELAAQIAAFDVRYAPDEGALPHALNGRRFTELKLRLDNDTVRNAYELFHSGCFVLLHFASDDRLNDVVPWEGYGHIQVVRASIAGSGNEAEWDDVHTALIRPDGHIAWAVPRSEPQPLEAIKRGIARWCGSHHI